MVVPPVVIPPVVIPPVAAAPVADAPVAVPPVAIAPAAVPPVVIAPVVAAGDEDPWQAVQRRNPAAEHRRALRHQVPCPFGLRCKHRGECGKLHDDNDRRLWQSKGPKFNFKYWKTRPCNPAYHNGADKNCPYYHSPADAWCLACYAYGHCTDDCKFTRG